MDNHGKIFYTTYIIVDVAHHEIVRAKVGMGDKMTLSLFSWFYISCLFIFINLLKTDVQSAQLLLKFLKL